MRLIEHSYTADGSEYEVVDGPRRLGAVIEERDASGNYVWGAMFPDDYDDGNVYESQDDAVAALTRRAA